MGPAHQDMSSPCLPAAAIMSSVLQKLISPLASSPAEPPRNKVTVVGVGQVGMACAVSILLRVRHSSCIHVLYVQKQYLIKMYPCIR